MENTTMTIQEVADAMGVSYDTVRHAVNRVLPSKIRNGVITRLTESEVAIISKELKSNTSVMSHQTLEVSSKVQNTTTELEILANYKAASEAFTKMLQQKNAALEAQVAELAPKAEVYSLCCDSERLHTIQDLGKITGIGAQNIFDRLVKDCVIYRVVSDGDKHYRSHYQYDRYFKPIIEPYSQNGKPKTHSRLMLTTEGFMHFCKKYGTKGATEWQ